MKKLKQNKEKSRMRPKIKLNQMKHKGGNKREHCKMPGNFTQEIKI